jgi:hypothetical protein
MSLGPNHLSNISTVCERAAGTVVALAAARLPVGSSTPDLAPGHSPHWDFLSRGATVGLQRARRLRGLMLRRSPEGRLGV